MINENPSGLIHIIGGGVAGLMLAEALEKRGQTWRLYERSAYCGTEASGKNAGIVRTYEADPAIAAVANASLRYYVENEPSWRNIGILLRPWEVDYGIHEFEMRLFSHGRFSGYFLRDNGTIQPMELLGRLAQPAHRYGEIQYECEVEIKIQDSCVMLLMGDSPPQKLQTEDRLVIASGEGSIALSQALGISLGLIPHQRTLYEYRNVSGYAGPIEWDEESGCYFRPWQDCLVATAGEQIPVEAKYLPAQDRIMSESSLATLASEFPMLAQANLSDYRTCRRTMPLDNRPYCGRDARLPNVFWFTGLGGRGISIAPALAASLAALLCGEKPEHDLSPFSLMRV